MDGTIYSFAGWVIKFLITSLVVSISFPSSATRSYNMLISSGRNVFNLLDFVTVLTLKWPTQCANNSSSEHSLLEYFSTVFITLFFWRWSCVLGMHTFYLLDSCLLYKQMNNDRIFYIFRTVFHMLGSFFLLHVPQPIHNNYRVLFFELSYQYLYIWILSFFFVLLL